MFNTYEELLAHSDRRKDDVLTLEVDLGGVYSQEHEDAKEELQKMEALQMLTGESGGFLSNNLPELRARVEATRPEQALVWLKFKRLPLKAWSALSKKQGMTPIDQFEAALDDTFIGLFGSDEPGVEPLSINPDCLRLDSESAILPGAALHSVVQSFMSWQNAGGDVVIRPTRSGQG